MHHQGRRSAAFLAEKARRVSDPPSSPCVLSENRIRKNSRKVVFWGEYRHVSEHPSTHPSIVLTCDTFCFGNFLLNPCSVWKKSMIGPFRLAPYFSPRPWGSLDLLPLVSRTTQRTDRRGMAHGQRLRH